MKLNLPNKITVARLVLSVIVLILIGVPWYQLGITWPVLFEVKTTPIELNYILAGVFFLIASVTDFLDGYIARSRNMVTDFGKTMDAIADKVLVDSVLIILASQGMIDTIIPVVVILRDIVVNAIKMEAASKGVVIAAIKSGKWKTASLMVGLVLVFCYNLPFEMWNLQVADFLMYFATIMSLISMFQYYFMNRKLIFSEEEKK